MRYETMMTVLRFAEKNVVVKPVGDWSTYDNGKRGPLITSLRQAIDEGLIQIDPANRVALTDAGYRKLNKVGGNVRITVSVPAEREADFRKMVGEFLK